MFDNIEFDYSFTLDQPVEAENHFYTSVQYGYEYTVTVEVRDFE